METFTIRFHILLNKNANSFANNPGQNTSILSKERSKGNKKENSLPKSLYLRKSSTFNPYSSVRNILFYTCPFKTRGLHKARLKYSAKL